MAVKKFVFRENWVGSHSYLNYLSFEMEEECLKKNWSY